ncbi:MAG: hypothetical protein V2A64_01995 [Candidatus Omnitrophota bacterium]
MEDKGFSKTDLDFQPVETGGLKPKITELNRRLFVFTKFVFGLCFLPFVYSLTVSFLTQLGLIDQTAQDYFWAGILTFLFVYLFVWEPVIVYTKGQKLVEVLFVFFKPLVKVAPYLLPVYSILLIIIYGISSWIFKCPLDYFIFLFGLSIALHLVFSAKTLRSKKADFFKANYIFSFSLVYIINLFLIAFFLNIIFDKFSFVKFCNDSFQAAQAIFSRIIKQLFYN